MPVYEYSCEKCGKRFDKLVHSYTKVEDLRCPQCGSAAVERVLSVFASSCSTSKGTSSSSSCGTGGGFT